MVLFFGFVLFFLQIRNLHNGTTTESSFSGVRPTHPWFCLHLQEGNCKSANFVVLGPRTAKGLICVVKSAVFAVDLGGMSLLANQESIKSLLS